MAGQIKPPIWAPGIVPVGHPMRNGLARSMPLWDGSGDQAMDVSGNGKHMTLAGTTGTPTWVADYLHFVRASEQYAETDSSPVTDYPFSLTAEFRTVNMSNDQFVISVNTSTSSANWQGIRLISDQIQASSRGSTIGAAGWSPPVPDNVWFVATAVFRSLVDRELYVDGVSRATNTSSIGMIAGANRVALGQTSDSSASSWMDGDIGIAMIHDTDLSAGLIAQLHADIYALNTPPDNLALFSAATQGGGAPPATGMPRPKANGSLANGRGRLVA